MNVTNHKYFNVIIENDSFRILETNSKPKKCGSALTTLNLIAEVVNKNLKYASVGDTYSKMPLEDIYKILQERAVKISNGYREKSLKLNWFCKLIFRFTGKQKEIDLARTRIENRISKPKIFPSFSQEIVQKILSYLPLLDLKHFLQLNQDGKNQAAQAILTRAREFGYIGHDPLDADEYMKQLYQEVNLGSTPMGYDLLDVDTYIKELDQKVTFNSTPNRIFKKKWIKHAREQGNMSKHLDTETILNSMKRSATIGEIFSTIHSCTVYSQKYSGDTFKDYKVGHIDSYAMKLLFEKIKNTPPTKEFYSSATLLDAIKRGDAELAKIALQYGADPNVRGDPTQPTSLMKACSSPNPNLEIIRLLLENHADPTIVGPNGETALSLAQRKGHLEVVEILTNHASRN